MAMAWSPGGGRKPPQVQKPQVQQRPPVGVPGAEPGGSAPYVPIPGLEGKPTVPLDPRFSMGKPTPPQQTQRPRGGGGQSPPYIPSFPMPGPAGGGMKPDVMPEKPQMGGGKPAWQILAENGIKGQGSAAGNRAALAGLPQQAQGQGIDGAIQSLRAQLGQPQEPAQGSPFTPQILGNFRRNTQGMTPQDIQMQMGGTPKPPTWQDGPLGVAGGNGSDLGFQSGGGFMGQGQQPQNPYLDILRQRLGGGRAPNPMMFADPSAPTGRFAY